MKKLGKFEFSEGDKIRIDGYIFEIRHNDIMLTKITGYGGLVYVDFEEGILLLLLQNCKSWSIEHKKEK